MKEIINKQLTFKESLGKEVINFIKTNISGIEVKREVEKYEKKDEVY